jgi:hypothetical protein
MPTSAWPKDAFNKPNVPMIKVFRIVPLVAITLKHFARYQAGNIEKATVHASAITVIVVALEVANTVLFEQPKSSNVC